MANTAKGWWRRGGLPIFQPNYDTGDWHVTDICDQCGRFRDAHFSLLFPGPVGGRGGPDCKGGGPWRRKNWAKAV